MALDVLKVTIERGPDAAAAQQSFDVPAYENQTVLDVVSWVQQNADPTLSYQVCLPRRHVWSLCDDGERRAALDLPDAYLKGAGRQCSHIGPLRNLPVIKDLAVDMDPFFDKWVAAEGVHHGALTRDDPIAPVDEDSAARVTANAGIECINCSVCYAACDTVAGNPDYLGPAACNARGRC